AEKRRLLSEPGDVVTDETEMSRLGFEYVGDVAEVLGRRLRLVAVVRGLKSLAAPYLFCSLQTSRMVFQGIEPDQTIFILARCKYPATAREVAKRLRHQYALSAFTSEELSTQTQVRWMTTTKAGVTAVWSAIVGLAIGVVIACQALYSATAASWREYAALEALGIPSWRIAAAVLSQSFWVGAAGLACAAPVTLTLADLFGLIGVRLVFPIWLVVPTAGGALAPVLLSGLVAPPPLRLAPPAGLFP